MIFKLAEITNELKEKGEVIECGDWNAIISDYSGLLEHDEFDDHVPLPDDYLSNDRATLKSEDRSTNVYKSELISLSINRRILFFRPDSLKKW